jgi:succinate dehydrogenase / fumarate reductase flavoprotein subunit
VIRYNDRLRQTDNKLQELIERYRRVNLNDANRWATMVLPHARQLYNMLQLARVITLGALARNETRGAHYKPEFPARNDDEWLRTTKASFSDEAPVFSYEEVDTSLIKPRVRDYSKAKVAETEHATGAEMEPAGSDRYAEDEKLKAEQQTASQSHESLDRRAERL